MFVIRRSASAVASPVGPGPGVCASMARRLTPNPGLHVIMVLALIACSSQLLVDANSWW